MNTHVGLTPKGAEAESNAPPGHVSPACGWRSRLAAAVAGTRAITAASLALMTVAMTLAEPAHAIGGVSVNAPSGTSGVLDVSWWSPAAAPNNQTLVGFDVGFRRLDRSIGVGPIEDDRIFDWNWNPSGEGRQNHFFQQRRWNGCQLTGASQRSVTFRHLNPGTEYQVIVRERYHRDGYGSTAFTSGDWKSRVRRTRSDGARSRPRVSIELPGGGHVGAVNEGEDLTVRVVVDLPRVDYWTHPYDGVRLRLQDGWNGPRGPGQTHPVFGGLFAHKVALGRQTTRRYYDYSARIVEGSACSSPVTVRLQNVGMSRRNRPAPDERFDIGRDSVRFNISTTGGPVVGDSNAVFRTGDYIVLRFNESVQTNRLPAISAFEVYVDGVARTFTSITANARTVNLAGFEPDIQQGQTVRVSYADPTCGNDVNAIQDRV